MKILRIEFSKIGIFKDNFLVDFIAMDKVVDKNSVSHIYKNVYHQNVVSFVGINATGKTSALRLINLAMDIVLSNEGLNDIDVPQDIMIDGSEISVYFYLEDRIYKYYAILGKDSEENDDLISKSSYHFKEEFVFSKSKSTPKSKKEVFNFSDEDLVLTRSDIKKESSFLKKQDSIISAIVESSKTNHLDMIAETNLNVLVSQGEAEKDFVGLFDNSIESISIDKKNVRLKFKNSTGEKKLDNPFSLTSILSSGTIKGINLLNRLSYVMKYGGYLIIDEIENHLHKKLVQTIIRFFTDPDINKKGATLIFSTHYIEIIDTIDRKDNIYILRKTNDLFIESIKYSDEIKRNDIKKSEVLLANLVEGTAPSYEDIMRVRKFLCD